MQARVRLHYTDIYILTSTAGIAAYTYSGNGAYSPDAISGTAQPYYFDRYASLYSNYVVLSSSISIKAAVDTGSNQCVLLAVAPFYKNSFPATSDGVR